MNDTESFTVMFGPEEKTIPVICSWCRNVFDTRRWQIPYGDRITPDYGICQDCLRRVRVEAVGRPEPQSTVKTYGILIVDDEGNFCGMMSDMLHPLGYRIITCGGGEDAVEYYSKLYADIDLVILDMKMPGMDGYETFLNMKKINPEIKAMVLTGFARDNDIREMLAAGALCVMEKPFNPAILLERIKDILHV
ncbi:MAG: response regulator [Victivallales bacterium]